MPWMLSTVLLLLALQGSTSADRQREELPTVNNPSLLSRTYAWLRNVVGSPYIVPTSSSIVDDTGETILNCSLIFDSIGPFCQYVISTEPESGICRSDFSMKTYSSCLEVVQECESPDNKKSICLSDLVPLCKENSEIDQFFIDYCSVVECVCNGESSSGGSASGSGSGSESGSGSGGSGFSGSGSGSGVEPTVIPTTGSPGPSTTEPTTTISTTGTTSSTTIPTSTNGITITTTTTAVDTGGTFVTTTATVTPFVPIVLVRVEDLTEEQRGNIVTIGFRGLNEEQFVDNAIIAFRVEIATMVNEFLLNQGQNRKKRQASSPVPVSPDDVIVIDPLRNVNGELLVSFVVDGEGGQSTPVSGTVLVNLLQMDGPNLATALSNAIGGQPVQFVEAFITTTTNTTSELPTTSQFPTTRAPPPPREEQEQIESLTSGAIAGIVIAVLVATVLLVAVVVVAIVALILGYRNSGGMIRNSKRKSPSLLQTYIQVTRHDDSHLTSEWHPMTSAMSERNEYVALPTNEGNGRTNEHTEL